ncbi:MAG: hypothetical protein ABIF71_08165 [Planctomycetota bacterium]
MAIHDDETSRLMSHLLVVYEAAFGYILAGGVITADTAAPLLWAGMALFLAGVGLHLFVNLEAVSADEYRRKHRRLWLAVWALLAGVAAAGTVSFDPMVNHAFFLVFVSFIVAQFLYYGLLRNTPLLGAAAYGTVRGLGVMAGAIMAGTVSPWALPGDVTYLLYGYLIFHVLCEFMRWSAATKGARLTILAGFVGIMGLMIWLFYRFTYTLDNSTSTLIVMILTLLLLLVVALPPLAAVRTVRAQPLLAIFPHGLAGGVLLTLIFFIVMQKDLRLMFLSVIAALILLFTRRSAGDEGETDHAIRP